MVTLRLGAERHHDRRHERDVWLTFYPRSSSDPLADGFGALEVFNEGRLPPGASVPRHAQHSAEIITYVRRGALAFEDSCGTSGIIQAGEFQRMTVGRGARHQHTNVSPLDWSHFYQMWLCPAEVGLEPSHEQKRFSVAQRRGVLCVVASPDARRGSLRIHQDAVICSAILDSGQHVVHELAPGRQVWLHVVQGQLTFGDVVLSAGDGVGVEAVRAVGLTAQEDSELLLVDLDVVQQQPIPGRGLS
ncbi:MAG: pirin family protein [Deltaproteobacteria bacterium]|jgi:redox-sensitive bicupin YhaK (pirin superfamily)|nr:pirin family protein [Deltaproteobacteria bacterium]MBW2532511.1 pirin family protein [Deltaproteobacteria bacterium]